MKKMTNRAISVLLLAALVIGGMLVYLIRYVDHGRDWALAFSRSGSSGSIVDRNGVVLASFDDSGSFFAEDEELRVANYHVTGDYWGRTATGLLSSYDAAMQGYSPLTGVTRPTDTVLQLNVDAELNRKAYKELNGRPGAVLICNYRTGELLCMVSSPAVDPADAAPTPGDGAYINRCLSASFVPGSVFKLVTAAAAMESLPDLESRSFNCTGSTEYGGVKITCSGTHHKESFETALANSCNVAFSALAVDMGHATMLRYVKQFGFLDSHSLDGIPTAAGNFLQEDRGAPELGWAGVGQSTDLVCPYALLRYVCAVANGGTVCEPMLIQGRPDRHSKLMEPETAQWLTEIMHYTVVHNYGGESRYPGLALCAKTGTAERGDGSTNAWFTGFLLDEEHPYAFVVMIEKGGTGYSAAGGLANKLLQFAVNR